MLLTMPGFIGNYKLPLAVPNEPTKVFNSLGCKLVTVFPKNVEANPPKSKILANILLLDENSGELKAIVQATEITAWRTAAASIVATKHLYFNRQTVMDTAHIPKTLAIVGCGVQVALEISTYLELLDGDRYELNIKIHLAIRRDVLMQLECV